MVLILENPDFIEKVRVLSIQFLEMGLLNQDLYHIRSNNYNKIGS
jgi:hypothetical protein